MGKLHHLYENHDSYVHANFHDFDPSPSTTTPTDVELVSRPCALNLVQLVGFVFGNFAYITFFDGSVSNPPKLVINLGHNQTSGTTEHSSPRGKKVYPIPGAGIRFDESIWVRVENNNQWPIISTVTVVYR